MENIPTELEIRGLMQGSNLSLQQVKDEICPECPYQTDFCEFMMRIHIEALEKEGTTFVCKGMRHWVIRSN